MTPSTMNFMWNSNRLRQLEHRLASNGIQLSISCVGTTNVYMLPPINGVAANGHPPSG
jgi:hypothetical protein